MEEYLVIDATLDQLAGSVQAVGAKRREPIKGEEAPQSPSGPR